MKKRLFHFLVIIFVFSFFIAGIISAQQNLPETRVSPQASVTQHLGFAKIEINFSRPGVKGREIWGKLIPYGLAPAEPPYGNGVSMPWRTGADENTTLCISHDAKINGNNVPAGTYGLFMIPGKEEWTIILNKDNKSWGAYFYNQTRDLLRFNVKPQQAQFQEWLNFGFENLTSGSCETFLQWEKVKIPFKIEFDEHKVTYDYYKELLNSDAGFYQEGWSQIAAYCLKNNYNLNEGLEFINKSMQLGGNSFGNKMIKAQLLIATGKNEEGNKLMASSLESASENELGAYARQLLNSNKIDEAIKIYESLTAKNPKVWNWFANLGRAYSAKGDKVKAKANYEKALSLAPEAQKARIESLIKN